MTYVQQTWQDGNPSYPASATRMAHIEAGIAAVESEIIGSDGKIGGPGSVGISGVTVGASGPGGTAGGSTSTAQDITSFSFSAWYGLVNAAVTVTLGAPTSSGISFPLFLIQDNVGGHGITIQGDAGVSINWVNGTLNSKINPGDVNTVVFYATSDLTGWLAYVITTAAANLSDLANVGTARSNLGVPILRSAKAASSTNLTLSGTQTVDGVALSVGDICFPFGQTTGSQNGPWVVQSGSWVRSDDYPPGSIINSGRMIRVIGGTANSGLYGTANTGSITVDTTVSTWTKLAPSTSGGGAFTPSTTVINATNSAWPVPTGAGTLKITCIGGGGGGGGAGTNAAAAAQAGAGAGGSGSVTQAIVSVGGNATLNVTIPTTGGVGGTGAAAGGAAGTTGAGGATSSVTGTGISVSALGGGGGVRSPASSTAAQQGGMPGSAGFNGGGSTTTPQGPGTGGASATAGAGPSTGGAALSYSGGGGSGGVSSSTTNGGNGGNAGTANAGGASASGTTATANGGNGANATAPGAGGGGGGGAPSGGAGGNGGNGGPPQVIIEVIG